MSTKVVGPGYPAIHPTSRAEGAPGGAILAPVNSVAGVASATITVGGTTGVGPTFPVTINGHAVTYTYVSGDTTTALAATHIAAAINADSTDAGIVNATANSNVITITALAQGSAGMVSLASAPTGGATATLSGSQLDLANNLVIAKKTQSVSLGGRTTTLYQDFLYQVDATSKSALRSAGVIY